MIIDIINFLIFIIFNSFCCFPCLLAVSSMLTFILNKKLGINALYFNMILHFIALVFAVLLLIDMYQTNILIYVNYGSWFESDDINIAWSFLFDTLSISMSFVVIFISFLVHFFSFIYMKNDPNINKFFGFLSLFSFFMLILVLSSNFILFFLGWEGIGLLSYLLINFWNSRAEANRSSLKAVFINRVGDLSFYIFLSLIYIHFGTFEFTECQVIVSEFYTFNVNIIGYKFNLTDLLAIFLLLGAIAKSSQFGLHMWLPDAMEGPTPVSALLHAATMVTAGVYLLMRCTWLIEFSPFALSCIFFIACLTNLFISLIGIFQHDIKKIIAYSTTTQLSYMFIACLLSEYTLAFFHLFNHAFFKASLFLTAGIIIHSVLNKQDIMFYNFLTNAKTLLYIYFFIGLLSLSGLPFLAGYYSKDFIIEFSLLSFNFSLNYFIHFILLLSVLFTAFYSFVLLNTLFWNINIYYLKSQKLNKFIEEYNFFLLIPTTLLSFGALFSGYIFSIILNNIDDNYFNDIFYFNLSYNMLYMSHFNNFNDFNVLYFGSLGCLLGYYIDYFLQFYFIPFKKDIYLYMNFYFRKLLSDLLLFYSTSFLSKTLYDLLWKYFDKYFLEYNNSFKLIIFIKNIVNRLNVYQHGSIYVHFFITISLLLFFDWVFVLINMLSTFFIFIYIYIY